MLAFAEGACSRDGLLLMAVAPRASSLEASWLPLKLSSSLQAKLFSDLSRRPTSSWGSGTAGRSTRLLSREKVLRLESQLLGVRAASSCSLRHAERRVLGMALVPVGTAQRRPAESDYESKLSI